MMETSHIKPPSEFLCLGNSSTPSALSRSWDNWVEHFDFYLLATEKHEKSDEIKVALMLTLLGSQCMDIFRTFELTIDEKKNLAVVKERFKAYCSPKLNEVFERHKFLSRTQKEAEPFDVFLLIYTIWVPLAIMKVMRRTKPFGTVL